MPSDSPFHFRPYLVAEDLDPAILRVKRITAHEEVSRSFRYELSTVCDLGAFELRKLLRKAAMVVVAHAEDGSIVRRMGGVVTRVTERASSHGVRQEGKVVIEDPLAMLRYTTDYRIFQDMTTKEIVEKVIGEGGIKSFEFRLEQPSRKRVVCTQYGETCRDFVSRLLEEDGIAWFVEHSEEGAKIVFADSPNGWSPTPFEKKIVFRQMTGMHPEEGLDELVMRARVRPSKVTLRDHDFEKPALDLEQTAEKSGALDREHYEYPGRYVVAGEGKARAKNVLAGHIARASAARAHGYVFRITAGHAFELENTPRAEGDLEWAVLAVTHEWEHGSDAEPRLDTVATVLPKDVPFAPEPLTERPRALGDHAIITTASGEEIHTDKHGRVKVQFVWDRYGKQDDKSSAWIRVGQMHTSGSVVIPRRGWEVMVEFEDGDPDRPIVMGRLYNGASLPTDPLPAKATNSALMSYSSPGGGGHNEIRMNDGGGAELVNVRAQKDLNLVVANNKKEKVTNSVEEGVGVDQKIEVGANEKTSIGSADSITVGGSQTYKVAAARTKTVTKDEKVGVKGDRSVSIAASHTTMSPQAVALSTSGNLTETIGGSAMDVAAMGISMTIAGSASMTVGGAKVEAVAAGKTDNNVGAKSSTIGGALLNVTPKDVSFTTSAGKQTTVGAAWMGNAGGNAEISSKSAIDIKVGGAIAFTAASKLVFKVGGSSMTLSGGAVVFESKEVKLTATGPAAELAPLVKSK